MSTGDNSLPGAVDSPLRRRLIGLVIAVGFVGGVWFKRGPGFGITALVALAILILAAVAVKRWRITVTGHPIPRWALGVPTLSLIEISIHGRSTAWSVLGIVVASAAALAWYIGYLHWKQGLLRWPNKRWQLRTVTFICLCAQEATLVNNDGGPVLRLVIACAFSSAFIMILWPHIWPLITAGPPRFVDRGRLDQ